VERWAHEYGLQINPTKTEYAVFNGGSDASIQLAGENIRAKRASTYLGLQRERDGHGMHLKNRLRKAKAASFAITRVFKRFPHLQVKHKLNIVQA